MEKNLIKRPGNDGALRGSTVNEYHLSSLTLHCYSITFQVIQPSLCERFNTALTFIGKLRSSPAAKHMRVPISRPGSHSRYFSDIFFQLD